MARRGYCVVGRDEVVAVLREAGFAAVGCLAHLAGVPAWPERFGVFRCKT